MEALVCVEFIDISTLDEFHEHFILYIVYVLFFVLYCLVDSWKHNVKHEHLCKWTL